MKRKYLYLFLLLLFAAPLAAQEEQATVSEELVCHKDAKNAFYTFNYPSVDAEGNPIVLSSALIAWKKQPSETDRIETLLIACHVTITANYECPSEYPKDGSVGSDVGIMQTIPVMGLAYERLRHSIIIMPDYEGYGVTKHRAHPYLAQALTARQVADAAIWGMYLYQKLVDAGTNPALADNWKSFCIGYSQGGATALATQRYIEEGGLAEPLHFAGSICAAGPYDLMATMRYYIQDDGTSHGASTAHRQNQLSMPVVMPLIVKGMCDANPSMKGRQLSDYFTKKFLDTGIVGWIEDKAGEKAEQKKTDDITRLLYDLCEKGLTAADGTTYTAKEMQQLFPTYKRTLGISGFTYTVYADLREVLRPECYDYFIRLDDLYSLPEDVREDDVAVRDLHRAMLSNTLADGWVPQHRVVFLHSKHDTIVPYDNYESFATHHPDLENTRIEIISKDDHLGTGTSFFASMLTTGLKDYFEWIVEGLDTSTGIEAAGTRLHPMQGRFDLTGRCLDRVVPPHKGLYIINGKKVANW
ncbi:MAG: hypothetical protein IJ064_03235 [Bacteroidaceae bacterium]|nr:hypothetical protein [Bacteroidaceae bacterium]